MKRDSSVEVVGAGPAGLAAAITLASAGAAVIVHEAKTEVGQRFQRDLQGLENWSSQEDVLHLLTTLGVSLDFRMLACREGTVFDAWDHAYRIQSEAPLFYMVERGPSPGTLDHALLARAIELGVEIRFSSRVRSVHGPGIFATGPKVADAVAVGYHFDTAMSDGFWAICDDRLAPGGYAYLLVMGGRGTVKSCMFRKTPHVGAYVQRTVAAFERLTGLQMINPREHGGVGNFAVPRSARSGDHPVAGEQAGFQDTLWGFGMRYAIISGMLAARSVLDGSDYDALWRREIGALMRTSVVNRAAYSLLGNRGYRWALRHQASRPDARAMLQRHYRPSLAKLALGPLARWRFKSQRQDPSCHRPDCDCVWCRHEVGHVAE
jgi:flavin-dependent dehydrogenase